MLNAVIFGALTGCAILAVDELVWRLLFWLRPIPPPRTNFIDVLQLLNKMAPFPGPESKPEPVKLFPHERKRLTHQKKGLTWDSTK